MRLRTNVGSGSSLRLLLPLLLVAGCGSVTPPPQAQEAPLLTESADPAPNAAKTEPVSNAAKTEPVSTVLETEPAPTASQSSQPACASCGESQAHALPELSASEFQEQLERFASEPLAGGSPGLETLLFHNTQTRDYLDVFGSAALDPEHRAFLEHHLARDHVVVAVRIIDAQGVERLTVQPTRVPLRKRSHLRSSNTVNLQAAALTGTVVRVGLDRLWVRY